MDDYRARLARCFAATFPELDETEIESAAITSVGAWDSMATVTLLALIQEEFGIAIPPEDIDRLISFGLILDYLHESEHR
jgi:acyl carrier protein